MMADSDLLCHRPSDRDCGGLSPLATADLVDRLDRLHREGLTLLIVDQQADIARRVASRALLLNRGTGRLKPVFADMETGLAVSYFD